MNPFIEACIKANEEIASALEKGFDASWYEKTEVGAGGDVSSKLDLFAEQIFFKYLSPFGHIESEESGIMGEGDVKIIIDPIDGSSNALSLFPYYGTSVARVNAAGLLDAAVVCNLANGDLFVKSGNDDVLQGQLFSAEFHPRHVSSASEIGLFEKAYAHPLLVAALDKLGFKFRAPGAIALSLAYAHTVEYVLFVGPFRIYDFAAGLALCEGLEVIVEADYVIVSKQKNVADKIEKLVKDLREE
ncbi:inositol monophosphatase family protein [Sulfurovum sp. NBC37-1]|uniref:inositol monophosphatase family protein n=1 Tax=Sulfurovum sp. (strain NBC37-1) TaxID=387093 RepID=UPI000158763F|nr:inositol monophosphatase family protein [Sulfurovum sp. NBC37-1]BAF71866.1 inositol monophosphatase family protein [Sulfurovum sp. NBC37-1]